MTKFRKMIKLKKTITKFSKDKLKLIKHTKNK